MHLFPRSSPESTEIAPRRDSSGPKPKRPAICTFQPLPPIVASPFCTPTTSVSNSDGYFVSFASQDDSSSRVHFPVTTPTWIATPPTPPAKPVRRSNTSSTRRYPVAPSASFPASMYTHAASNVHKTVRRSISVPALSFEHLEHPNSLSGLMAAHFLCRSPDEDPFDASFSVIDGSGPRMTRLREHAGSYVKASDVPSFLSLDSNDAGIFCKVDMCSAEEPSPAGSWSDHSIEDVREIERNKDALRRFHALKELLVTEVGYLTDLKALITVYMRSLPTLAVRSLASSNTFGRASSSFTSGPWIHSYTQLQAAAQSSTATLPEAETTPPSATPSLKEAPRSNSRYLFSDSELEVLTRNAEDILQVHEHFVRELRILLEPLGFVMQMDENDLGHDHLEHLDEAIRAISTKFATEASRFNAYQTFCAGHAAAMDILRRVYQHYPAELDAFEIRCNVMISELMDSKPPASEPQQKNHRSSTGSSAKQVHLSVEDRKRAMSLTSLDGAVKSLRPRSSLVLAKDSVSFPLEPRKEKASPRIALADYLIKPIQRICKYPLLLDQLLPSKTVRAFSELSADARSDVDVVVKSAAQAMRHVAASVDEARHRQDVATQSALIFSRICLSSSSGSSSPFAQALTPDFLASLGDCLLSGSMDVILYHPSTANGQNSSIKVKYLGAFLYSGGYLILVKASKGKKYEPRHWFSLANFEVSDEEEENFMLPCSFRLTSGDMYFEMAAACQREKDEWLVSINEALKCTSSWVNEPTPSYKFDSKGELLPESDEGRSESPVRLTTIPSIPEAGHVSDTELTEPFFASLRPNSKSKRKRTGYETPSSFKQESTPVSSRRSSSTSVKAIFSPMASDNETVVIRRSSHAARALVDQELQDVISESCLTARLYAFSHELELFQAPKTMRSGFTRSNSGISMAGMSRLSKHESVRVPRRRMTDSSENLGATRGSSPLTKNTNGKHNGHKLTITAQTPEEYGSLPQIQQDLSPSQNPSPTPSVLSPARYRVSSLRASDTGGSATYSLSPVPSCGSSGAEMALHKPRSFVRNVRELFHFRPASPALPFSSILPSQRSEHHLVPFNVIRRWTRESLRRRPRSVYDEPLGMESHFAEGEKTFSVSQVGAPTPLSA